MGKKIPLVVHGISCVGAPAWGFLSGAQTVHHGAVNLAGLSVECTAPAKIFPTPARQCTTPEKIFPSSA
jgi:hypothetical protein